MECQWTREKGGQSRGEAARSKAQRSKDFRRTFCKSGVCGGVSRSIRQEKDKRLKSGAQLSGGAPAWHAPGPELGSQHCKK